MARVNELPAASRSHAHIFSSSGGNAGLAAVHAARTFHLPCTVVVPDSTKEFMKSKLISAGAHAVIQKGATWKDADHYLQDVLIKEAKDQGVYPIYCPPFDHPDIWTGNATLMHEIANQLPLSANHPAAVVCSVGGGGLFNGVCQALLSAGPPNDMLRGPPVNTLDMEYYFRLGLWRLKQTAVVAVETEGADSLNKSLKAGKHVSLDAITSEATSLGALKVSEKTWEYATRKFPKELWNPPFLYDRAMAATENPLDDKQLNVRSVVLSDREAAQGSLLLADTERIMVELSCGVNVAMCANGRLEKALGRKLSKEEAVVIVVCGGSNISPEMLVEWRKQDASA